MRGYFPFEVIFFMISVTIAKLADDASSANKIRSVAFGGRATQFLGPHPPKSVLKGQG
jgi:hypothetical protein